MSDEIETEDELGGDDGGHREDEQGGETGGGDGDGDDGGDDEGDVYRNANGDDVPYEELTEAETAYVDDPNSDTVTVDEYVKNWEAENARDWEPSDDDDPLERGPED